MNRYDVILKPKWAPPAWVFGPVWSLLYSLLALSLVILVSAGAPLITFIPFIINIAINLSYLAVGNNLRLGAVIIALTLITAIVSAFAARKVSHAVSYLQIPYIIWLSFALALQLSLKEKSEE